MQEFLDENKEVLKKINFLYSLMMENRISNFKNLTQPEIVFICNKLDMLYSILNRYYKENWGIFLKYTDSDEYDYTYNIVIYYPETEISNTKGLTHLIKDLYVILPISYLKNSVENKAYVTFSKIKGYRETLSLQEAIYSYQHSHLSEMKGDHLPTFCLNSTTDLAELVSNFEIFENKHLLEYFFTCLDSLVSWESLEGKPHAYINNIKNAGLYELSEIKLDGLFFSKTNKDLLLVYNFLKENTLFINSLNFSKNNKYFILHFDDDVLIDLLIHFKNSVCEDFKYINKIDNLEKQKEKISKTNHILYIYFNNKKITQNVVFSETDTRYTYYISEELISELKNLFTLNFNTNYHAVNHNRKCVQ